MVEDQLVGDDGIDRALLVVDLALPHTVADRLAAAELHLLSIGAKLLFHLDDDVGIGKPHAVSGGRPEHLRIGGALHLGRHASYCEVFAGGPLRAFPSPLGETRRSSALRRARRPLPSPPYPVHSHPALTRSLQL